MAADAKQVDRALKLLALAMDLHAQQHDLHAEIRALLSGQDATGDILKRVEASFAAEWERAYGSKYQFQFAKDRPHWKRFIKAVGEPEILARIMAYFHEADQYTARAKHPFGLFVSRFNALASLAPSELTLDAPVVADCKHFPRCTSDQQHTKRKLEDYR